MAKTKKTDTKLPNVEEQAPVKLKAIRALRREVKRCELAYGGAKEELKFRKEELDAAVQALCKEIDGSAQGELFVAHVDTNTGELEGDDDASGAGEEGETTITLSAGGRSVTTNAAGLQRAARNAGRMSKAVSNARSAPKD